MQRRRIDDYGLIGDGNSAALVHRSGAVEWLCWPRFDSHGVFAAMLGDETHGHWTICPAAQHRVSRRYRKNTLILETRFDSDSGAVELIDFMPYGGESCTLIRRVKGIHGSTAMRMRFAPRLASGAELPRYERKPAGVEARGDSTTLALSSARADLCRGDDTVEFQVREGETISFILCNAPHVPVDPEAFAAQSEAQCEAFWRQWTARCRYEGPWRDEVQRSLITLKALIYVPSGGIVAAPTTSLPERMGGSRNWDYRFCWLRDSTFTVLALLHAGHGEEARAWVKWLRGAVAPSREAKTLYCITQKEGAEESEAPWLSGFNGSKPVRFGNDARNQLQLDIYGEVQDTLHQWRALADPKDHTGWSDQCAMLDKLAGLWTRPDAGIWEQRGRPECFTQSRAFAWLAFDRAIKSAERFGLDGPVASWRAQCERIHAEVCALGFDPDLNAFTRAYGSRSVDASTLLLPMVGFLPPNDPRIQGTVEAVRSHLGNGPFLYRYDQVREDDGVGGTEGVFLPCSFWLADTLILQKREEEGADLFNRILNAGNDLGLFSEEYDPSEKTSLGNFPQALSHLSIVHTAFNLTGAGPAHSRSESYY